MGSIKIEARVHMKLQCACGKVRADVSVHGNVKLLYLAATKAGWTITRPRKSAPVVVCGKCVKAERDEKDAKRKALEEARAERDEALRVYREKRDGPVKEKEPLSHAVDLP